MAAQIYPPQDTDMDRNSIQGEPQASSQDAGMAGSGLHSILTPNANPELYQIRHEFAQALNNMSITLEKPPKYAGKRTNDAAKIWLQRVELYLTQRGVVQNAIMDQYQRILLAASFLEKEALNWHLLVFNSTTALLITYEDWARSLAFRFRDVRTQQTRRDQWDALIQGGSAGAFAQRIQTDAMHLVPNPSEYDMLLLFKRGIKDEIRERIERLPDDYLPTDYAGYTAFADKQELELNANRAGADRRKSKRTNQQRNATPATPAQSEPNKDADGDTEMQLNTIRADALKVEKDEWFSRCRSRDACYNCGKEGHKGAECTKDRHQWKNKETTPSRGRGGGRGGRGRGSGNARGH